MQCLLGCERAHFTEGKLEQNLSGLQPPKFPRAKSKATRRPRPEGARGYARRSDLGNLIRQQYVFITGNIFKKCNSC